MGDRQATLCFQDFIPTCYLLNEKYDAGSVSNWNEKNSNKIQYKESE